MLRSCASLTIDPPGITIDVVFFFPDRNPMLDLIYDIAARRKCLVPMR
jgi:hypothetical protein